MEEKKLIEFRNIVKSFDSQVVLKGINLDIYVRVKRLPNVFLIAKFFS